MSWDSSWEVESRLRRAAQEEASTSSTHHHNGNTRILDVAADDWAAREVAELFGPPPAPPSRNLLAQGLDSYLLALDADPLIVKAGYLGEEIACRSGCMAGTLLKNHCMALRPGPHPHLPSQALTAMLIALVSDLIAQLLSAPHLRISWRRTLCIAAYGFVWTGPANHLWQEALERVRPGAALGPCSRVALLRRRRRRPSASRPPPAQLFPPSGDALRPLKKVALDQISFGPFTNLLLLVYFAVVVEGRWWRAAAARVARNYPGTQRNA